MNLFIVVDFSLLKCYEIPELLKGLHERVYKAIEGFGTLLRYCAGA